MTEDRMQDVCAGYFLSDQWRLSALMVAFHFVACGWAFTTKFVFAWVRNGGFKRPSWLPISRWLK